MLRRATDEDRERVLEWRNHPEVRRASFTRHVISPEEHAQWWTNVGNDSSRLVLIYEHFGVPCGVVTFSGVASAGTPIELTWGYYLDLVGLEERGETLTAWLGIQTESLDYAFETLAARRVVGQVLESNTPVRRLHRRYGIREVGEDARKVDGGDVQFVDIEITADEWATRRQSANQT